MTGAGGYVGRALLPALLAAGITPRAHASGDLSDPEILGALDFAGVDVVYHLAGIAHQQADAADYRRVNVDMSRQLAERALAAGVRRFVFLSSVKAIGASSAGPANDRPANDRSANDRSGGDNPRHESPTNDGLADAELDYALSKALAERALNAVCNGQSMELLVLRPALVYSADAPGHLGWLRRWASLRLPGPPQGGARSMVARDDLVRLLVLLATCDCLAGPLTLTDGERYSTARIHAAFVRRLERSPLLPALPRPFWKMLAGFADRARGEPSGTHWGRLVDDDLYPSEGLDTLGFSPSLTFERCLGLVD